MEIKELEQRWHEFVVGSDRGIETQLEDGTTPEMWIEQGYSPVEFQDWFRAGGFDPQRVKILESFGFSIDELSRLVSFEESTEIGLPYFGYSIAYMFCNGDLSPDDISDLVNNRDR